MEWVVNTTHQPLFPRERPGTHSVGGWAVRRAGLDVCSKSRPHWDFIPGLSSLWRVATLTVLSWPTPKLVQQKFMERMTSTCVVLWKLCLKVHPVIWLKMPWHYAYYSFSNPSSWDEIWDQSLPNMICLLTCVFVSTVLNFTLGLLKK